MSPLAALLCSRGLLWIDIAGRDSCGRPRSGHRRIDVILETVSRPASCSWSPPSGHVDLMVQGPVWQLFSTSFPALRVKTLLDAVLDGARAGEVQSLSERRTVWQCVWSASLSVRVLGWSACRPEERCYSVLEKCALHFSFRLTSGRFSLHMC